MTKGQRQDFIREIKKTLARFLSILFIVLLGVAFFAGIRSSEPAMKRTVDTYLDAQNFMDIRILSTLGLTDDDLEAIRGVYGVEAAEGIYSVDVLTEVDGTQMALEVVSVPEDISLFYVTEGRLPLKQGECILDDAYAQDYGYSVGDTITVYSGTSDDISESLQTDTYVIVGLGKNPYYLTYQRGNTSIGNGNLAGFMAIAKADFVTDIYTQIYVTVEGARELSCYSNEYLTLIDELQEWLEAIAEDRCEIRYAEIYTAAMDSIEEAEALLTDGAEQLATAWEELAEGYQALLDAEEEYEAGLAEWEEGCLAIEEAKEELAEGKTQLAEAEAEYEEGLIQVVVLETVLSAAQTVYEQELETYYQLVAQLELQQLQTRQQIETWLRENGLIAEEEDGEETEAETTAEAETEETSAAVTEAETAAAEATGTVTGVSVLTGSGRTALTLSAASSQTALALLSEEETEAETRAAAEETSEAAEEASAVEETSEAAAETRSAAEETLAAEETSAAEEGEAQTSYPWQSSTEDLSSQIAALESTLESVIESVSEALETSAAEETQEEQETQATIRIEDIYDALDSGNQEMLALFQSYLSQQKATLDAYVVQVAAARVQLNAAALQIAAAKLTIAEGEVEIALAEAELAAAEETLLTAREELDAAWEEYYEGEEELARAQEEYDEENADALAQIADAKKALAELDEATWYVLDRDTIQAYVEFGQDAESIGGLSQVFPSIFFLVAALVSLTTMTRMVEEQRVQIGTMKALGYGKWAIMSKYLLYALAASLLGGIFGALIGGKLIPYIVITAYKLMYENLVGIEFPYYLGNSLLAVALAVGCTTFASFFSCYRELMAQPAALMRPAAPKQGKRVLLENIGFLWRRLNFNMKSTIRNLMRYKKRIFMTVFGIGASMGLLLVGFGLRDSLTDIVDNQYTSLWKYDIYVDVDTGAEEEALAALSAYLSGSEEISRSQEIVSKSLDFEGKGGTYSGTLQVILETEGLEDFIVLRESEDGEVWELDDKTVVLTRKLASLLDVEVGDTIYLKESETKSYAVRVGFITEHYLNHYVYMSAALYEEVFGEEAVGNQIQILLTESGEEGQETIAAELLSLDAVQSVYMTYDLHTQIRSMIHSLDLVVIVLIVSAGLLAYVVLYNLNNINIAERRRELATLKVLGFYDMEVAMYVYRENVILTALGIVAGGFMGIALHRYLIYTVEIEAMYFGRQIKVPSFLYGGLLTLAFALIVNVSMYYKLKKIDMVESLKSVE